MQNTKSTKKATRKLTNIDFSREGAAVSLVGPSVGSAANGYKTLVMKATEPVETIKKMQQIQVTLELPEFLRKFFCMYSEDADVLARMLGYVPPEPNSSDMASSYEDYIQTKLQSFEIIKSLENVENKTEALRQLSDEEYLSLKQDQALIEPILKQAEDKPLIKENQMEQNQDASTVDSVETVAKSQFESIQKQLDDTRVLLEKAQAQAAEFEAKEKEAVVKSKTAKILAIVKNADHAAIITKASLELDSEDDFSAFVAAVEAMMQTVNLSEAFVEKGASGSAEEKVEESLVAKAVKAQLAQK